jgi:phosphoglycolate phosphatase
MIKAGLSGCRGVVVLDLDGTLVDSAEGITVALNEIGFGSHKTTVERTRGLVSFGVERLVQDSLSVADVDIQEAVLAFRAQYNLEPCKPDAIYPGTIEAMEGLLEIGCAISVCTNKPKALAESVLQITGLMKYMKSVVGGEVGIPSKPHPAPLLRAIALTEAFGPAIFVGDSVVDGETAKRSNVDFVFAAYGYGHNEPNWPSIATIAALNELPEVVQAWAEVKSRTEIKTNAQHGVLG